MGTHSAHILNAQLSVLRQVMLSLHPHAQVPVRDHRALSHPSHQRRPNALLFFCHVSQIAIPDHRLTGILQVVGGWIGVTSVSVQSEVVVIVCEDR